MTWAWALFLVYAVSTGLLAWQSSRGGDTTTSFAIGSGRMSPWMAGITLGACLASSSTFAIMPGFVYAEGLPALIGFSLPLIAGIAVGLLALAFRFQKEGARFGALTVPHWLGARYESPGLRRMFAALNILNVAYLVLITVGCGYVMEAALGISYSWAVIGIVSFVFAYTGLGGATAHAWTNSLQGVVMLAVAVALFLSGAHLWPGVAADLASTGLTREGSAFFSTHAEVWLVPFGMGFALTTQPHLLSKALYVQGPRELALTIALGVGTFAVFCLVLVAGAYARLVLPADLPQDAVMARYLQVAFSSPAVTAGMSVAILAAAMSTMDGLLVAVAASVGNDVFPNRGSVWVNRLVLVGLALVTIAGALYPPKLVLALGQLGVYGLVAASSGPLVVGLFARGKLDARFAFASSITALVVHFSLAMVHPNPGVAALAAIALAVPVAALGPILGNSLRDGAADGVRPALAEVTR
jgi:sodium/pantothenate symporter